MTQIQFHKSYQAKHLATAISMAGERYTPKLNVEVSIASVFDGLGRTPRFYDQLKRPAGEIVKNVRGIHKVEEIKKVADKEFGWLNQCLQDLVDVILKTPNTGVKRIDFRKIYALSKSANEAVHACLELLRKVEEDDRRVFDEQRKVSKPKTRERILDFEERFRNEKHHFYKILGALHSLISFSQGNAALAANNPRILLNGMAGSGKTHFLCDLAKHRIENDLPTYMFLGEEFDSKDPWVTIRHKLNAGVSKANLLKSLNQYAASKRTRAIIIVDAVNESGVSGVRWESLNVINKYKNLGLILSVRSGFEQSDVPSSVLRKYVRVEHEGFSTHEWEAVTKYFTEYGLPLPEVPLLYPEFRIPLFLKIFCQASARSSQPIKGHRGFTHIFEKYVIAQGNAVLKSLNVPGESVRRIWNGTIKEFALYMGENGTDRVSERRALSFTAKQFPTLGRKALSLLEKYGLLTKVPRYKRSTIVGFDYRFPYQKFSDHLIVRNLLTKHLDPSNPIQSFKVGTILGDIVNKDWGNRGLIEALSIQVPERLLGRELVYVAPKRFRYRDIARDSFLESLIWRDLSLENGEDGRTKYIRQRWVLNYINRYILPLQGGNDKILETLLSVAAIPHHPLNAGLLHRHLSKQPMPKRDVFWLPFINERYGEEGVITRLLTWAWDGGPKESLSDESVRLASIPLVWFLASSNRFLRDRATKALVALLKSRIPVLLRVLKDFKLVDDPYIQERIYAVAYGCILQPGNTKDDVRRVAIYVYETIFKDKKPPTHILLRDYARGVVEKTIKLDPAFGKRIDVARIRPPYGSPFPTDIPSLEELRRKYHPKRRSFRPSKRDDYGFIWNSLMYNNEGGIADFGNYVVNSTLNRWYNLRLFHDGHREKTVKEMDADFNAGLTKNQKDKWDKLQSMHQGIHWQLTLLSMPPRDQLTQSTFSREELISFQKAVRKIERGFVKNLRKEQRGLYRKGVLPLRNNSLRSDDLDNAAIQRLIFARIVQLGWRPKLFSKYDTSVRNVSRESHKSERIGKKYQWIAFHQILGIIADNFVFRGNWRDNPEEYRGPWQMWERDIDPSCLLKKTPIDPKIKKPWWIGVSYKNWRPTLTHTQWAKLKSDVPNQKRLIEVRARGGWLLLDGYVKWEQPPVPGEDRFDKTSREVWYILRSYIVKRREAKKIFAWAKKQDFMGRWMPDPLEVRNLFLKEFPHSIAYKSEYDPSYGQRWTEIEGKDHIPTGLKVIRTTEEYHWEGNGVDCSVDEGFKICLPAREVVKALGLTQTKEPGKFIDGKGEVVVLDPAVEETGASALLVRKKPFLKFLKDHHYELIWAVMGEKLLMGTMGGGPGFLGRLEMGGAFRIGAQTKLTGRVYTKFLPPDKPQ